MKIVIVVVVPPKKKMIKASGKGKAQFLFKKVLIVNSNPLFLFLPFLFLSEIKEGFLELLLLFWKKEEKEKEKMVRCLSLHYRGS